MSGELSPNVFSIIMLPLLPGGLVGFDSVLDCVLLESGFVNVRDVLDSVVESVRVIVLELELDVVSLVDSVRENERDELVVTVVVLFMVKSGLVRVVVVCVDDGRILLSTVRNTWISKQYSRADTYASCTIHHKSYICHNCYLDTCACHPTQSEGRDSWSFSPV